MSEILLSICISSYNRGSKCVRLVEKILTVEDDRYNIFICDDCSNKDTIEKLKNLRSSKVFLIQNKKNVGPCKNWFNTIDCGTGRYILHVLDRDDIFINKIKIVLDILEKSSVGAGYFGKSAMYLVDGIKKHISFSVCKKGKEAFLTMAGIAIHPTGFFVKKSVWEQGNYKKFFYQSNKYGIYPHSYVLSDIALKKDMLFSPISFYYIAYRTENKKSRFYKKSNNKDYWWMPDSVIKTDNCLIAYCCKIAEKKYIDEFICRRFRDSLNRSTIIYKKISASQSEMEHYGLNADFVSPWKLLLISTKHWITFLIVLKKIKIQNKTIRNELRNIWVSNIKIIVEMIKKKNIFEELLSVSNHNLALFRVMNQWVKIKQEGRNLSEYFEKEGYKRIAIYGMGYVGETLIEELKDTTISVIYGIDKNANAVYSSINIVSINEILEQVDAIVVTIVDSFSNISTELSKKVKYPIISLYDIVYDI